MLDKHEWTEADLENLIKQGESFRLEFKSASVLAKDKNKLIEELTKIVSAFANSDGGTVVVGINEGSSKERKSGRRPWIDGIQSGQVNASWLQQIITDNVSPLLVGVRVHTVKLSGPNDGKLAFVIQVPAGMTAYQASDKRYYGRFEYENRALPDHEIRMRMMRGRFPRIEIELSDFALWTAQQEAARRQQLLSQLRHAREDNSKRGLDGELHIGYRHLGPSPQELELEHEPERTYDELTFCSTICNTGEVTVRDYLLEVSVTSRYVVCSPDNWQDETKTKWAWYMDTKIYPSLQYPYPAGKWQVKLPIGSQVRPTDVLFKWTVYIDDAPPNTGEIDLSTQIPSAF